jgi:hypothetical protein
MKPYWRSSTQWAEIDTDDHVWTAPATRTKAKREHAVPPRRS